MKKAIATTILALGAACTTVPAIAESPPQASMQLDIPDRNDKIQKGTAIALLVKHYGQPIVQGQGSYCAEIIWTDCRRKDHAAQWQYIYQGDVINVFHRNLKILHIEFANP